MSEGTVKEISCGVLVVGGGVSGVSASVASARGGASTVLLEKEGFLGGIGYSALLRQICGLYLNGGAMPTETLNPGLPRELASALMRISPQRGIKRIGDVYVLPFKREELGYFLQSLCGGESGLSVCLSTSAVSVEKRGGVIVKVRAERPGAMALDISPEVVIDCSGGGGFSEMAGAPYEISPPEEIQLAGYVIHLRGIEDMDDALSVKVPFFLARAVREGLFSPELRFSAFSAGDAPDEGYCKISIDAQRARKEGRRAEEDALKVFGFLKDNLSEFRSSYIAETSSGVAEREGRRILCEYTLTGEDVLEGRKFQDGAVKNSWPMEIWDKRKGPVYRYLRPGDYYEIPFRCLKARDMENLLCAGPLISATHEALGSTRVMGACMALGEEAGKAAANKIKKGVFYERNDG